jgi:exonuclease SbcD
LKLVHAADLHIDSPLRGLSRYEGAPVDLLRNATRRALENLVELCIQEEAGLLLLAGDIFDGDWRDYATGLFFAAQMARLRRAGVRVALVRGNHDAASQISRELRLPDNVHELPTKKPGSLVFEDLGVAVHGQGFAAREVREDLAARYPQPLASLFNIGLLHTSLGGRPGHATYAPSTIDVLRARGYDYWALGHVHAREVVCEEPLIVFPGNLQGRHARETGAKGATLIALQDGRIADVRHEPLDVVRFCVCQVDLSSAHDAHDAVELTRARLSEHAREAAGRLLAARVVLRGATRAHAQLMRDDERWLPQFQACALDVAEGAIWLEAVHVRTSGVESAARSAERDDAIGQLVAALDGAAGDEAALRALCAAFTELKLPRDAGSGDDGVRLDDPAFIAELLPEVRELLLSRLLPGDGA